MNIDKCLTVGQRFKRIRKEKGISQRDLCEGICSYSVVSHIETDRQYPSAHIWGKLADRLGVPVYEIMGEHEKDMDVGFQLEIIRVYLEKGDSLHALKLVDELETRQNLLGYQRDELMVCRMDCLVKGKRYVEAIDLIMPFVEQQEVHQTVSHETLCDIYNKLGNAYYWLHDFERAYSSYEQGYRISLKVPEFGHISARVTKNLGLTCNQLGFKDDARRYLEKAHRYFERMSDLKELANTLFDLALVTGSVDYIVKAKSLYESMNFLHEANLAKQHYAFHVESKIDYQKAVEDLTMTAVEVEKAGDLDLSVYIFSRAAKVCIEYGEVERAQSCLVQAEERIQQLANSAPFYTSYFHKINAELKLIQGLYDECVCDAVKASELYAIMGMNVDSGESMEICTRAYEMQHNIEKALESSKKVVDLLRKSHRRNEACGKY